VLYSIQIFAGHVQLLTWHDCSSRGKTPGRGAGAWRPKALEELEKDFSGLKVMRRVRHVYKLLTYETLVVLSRVSLCGTAVPLSSQSSAML
jgi:hypothetical protein